MASQYSWSSADAYERYVGRWSRLVAEDFLAWLAQPPGLDWLEVGCGTGALTERILRRADPRRIRAYDLSPQFVDAARARLADPRVAFEQANAMALPEPGPAFDVAVSGLMINFAPEPDRVVREMRRVVRPGGSVAVYVWDYAGGMQMMRLFWDAAVEVDAAAADRHEGSRFPLCRSDPLRALFQQAQLSDIEVRAIDVPTRFRDFDDYWKPFEGGQGPAPGYLASLPGDARSRLRDAVASRLPRSADGSIALVARAWGVKARVT